ncbi:MAG TPA: copper-binding protein [Isosphaeraceae bacterium]|jgi:protein SCO1/2|nr:copper-binding protein [Isosphaeraceae bacterium]
MKHAHTMIATPLLAAALAGCSGTAGTPPSAATPTAAPAATSARNHRLMGVVKGVDPEAGTVTIRHAPIPEVGMGAMTMVFTVADRGELAQVHAGDEVEAVLRAGEGSWELKNLVVTRPAPPPTLTIDLGEQGPELRDAPRVLEPGEAVPDFAMTTQEGEPLRLSDLRGKVVVLTFIYTRCPVPDFCPLTDRKFGELARAIGPGTRRAADVRLLEVSFDPEHDTPAALAEHARALGARPPLWTFAVASHRELEKVAPALGLSYGPTATEIIHNRTVAVVGPDGRLVRLETRKDWDPTALARELAGLARRDRP